MQAHPYADLFPMMTSAELDALAADVAEHGLRHPVVRYQGLILDGRNRLLACEKAGVTPTFVDHEGDGASALALVISLNVQRRDMTAAQRAITAARALPMFETAADQRKKAGKRLGTDSAQGRKSRDDAAKVFKVGVNAVQQAKAILTSAPDLASQVEACALSLAAAYQQLQERDKEERRKLREAEQKAKDAEKAAHYHDAISNGEMSLEDAIAAIREEEREAKEKVAAEADARSNWLKELSGVVGWLERHAPASPDFVAWNFTPNTPGWFDHGLTADRVGDAVARLEQVRATLTQGVHENGE